MLHLFIPSQHCELIENESGELNKIFLLSSSSRGNYFIKERAPGLLKAQRWFHSEKSETAAPHPAVPTGRRNRTSLPISAPESNALLCAVRDRWQAGSAAPCEARAQHRNHGSLPRGLGTSRPALQFPV